MKNFVESLGYGHIAPTSENGRLAVIVYAVIALPLMSVFLVKVAAAITHFNKVCFLSKTCHCFFVEVCLQSMHLPIMSLTTKVTV